MPLSKIAYQFSWVLNRKWADMARKREDHDSQKLSYAGQHQRYTGIPRSNRVYSQVC